MMESYELDSWVWEEGGPGRVIAVAVRYFNSPRKLERRWKESGRQLVTEGTTYYRARAIAVLHDFLEAEVSC